MVCLIKFYYLCSMDTLLGKNLEELQQISLALGLPKFTGKQIAEWLYVRRVTTFDEMTNISKKGRDLLGLHKGRYYPHCERGRYQIYSYAVHRYFRSNEKCGHYGFADREGSQ